jgi:phospholipase C
MTDLSRRSLLRGGVAATSAAALASMTPAAGALAAATGRNRRFGDIRDIKHVVILMQENRSFDHYFGSL